MPHPGRGRGRGGREGGRNRGRGKGPRSSKSTKTEELKFGTQNPNKPQTATYTTVKDAILERIQRDYKHGYDTAKSLREGQKIDLTSEKPQRQLVTGTDGAAKIAQDGMDIEYQLELKCWMDRNNTLDNNLRKAYSLIFTSYCTKEMQRRVKDHIDFESTIRDDPIELLTAIRTLTHDPVRARYPFASAFDAISRAVNLKQQKHENLHDYVECAKQQCDVLKQHLGKDIFHTFVESTEEYRKTTDVAAK